MEETCRVETWDTASRPETWDSLALHTPHSAPDSHSSWSRIQYCQTWASDPRYAHQRPGRSDPCGRRCVHLWDLLSPAAAETDCRGSEDPESLSPGMFLVLMLTTSALTAARTGNHSTSHTAPADALSWGGSAPCHRGRELFPVQHVTRVHVTAADCPPGVWPAAAGSAAPWSAAPAAVSACSSPGPGPPAVVVEAWGLELELGVTHSSDTLGTGWWREDAAVAVDHVVVVVVDSSVSHGNSESLSVGWSTWDTGAWSPIRKYFTHNSQEERISKTELHSQRYFLSWHILLITLVTTQLLIILEIPGSCWDDVSGNSFLLNISENSDSHSWDVSHSENCWMKLMMILWFLISAELTISNSCLKWNSFEIRFPKNINAFYANNFNHF